MKIYKEVILFITYSIFYQFRFEKIIIKTIHFSNNFFYFRVVDKFIK